MKVDAKKTYLGVVEDNKDPKKAGRVKVRVMNVYENMPLEDIPWAFSWKDLNGNEFNLPDKGKVVMVVFEDGDGNKPEYIYADHYNINLEKKLQSLSDSDYLTMKSLIFDHKTQIYVNDKEGLKIDHKYNNLNITENTIDINLKDNNRNVNIGDATANQQAILGNHWMDWFDEFVDNLLGSQAGPFLGNLGAPVIPNPAFISCLLKYKALRDPVFLSHHVNIVDNNKVSTVGMTKREDDGTIGDNWASTVQENTLTEKREEDFKPVEGPKTPYEEKPPVVTGTSSSAPTKEPLSSIKSDPKLEKIIKFMKSKGYKVFEEPGLINLVSMRTKDTGQVTNKFDDILYLFYKKENQNWQLLEYEITTLPGYEPPASNTSLPKDVPIIAYGQFIDKLKLDTHVKIIPESTDSEGRLRPISREEHKALRFTEVAIYRNKSTYKYDYKSPIETGDFNLWIRRGPKTGSAEKVFNYSDDGSQVFKNISQYNQFISLIEEQSKTNNIFSYAICRKSEFIEYIPESDQKQDQKSQSDTQTQDSPELTGDEELDLIISKNNITNVRKLSNGIRQVTTNLGPSISNKIIVFDNNKSFTVRDRNVPNPKEFILKGTFKDGGNTLVVSEGKVSRNNFKSDNLIKNLYDIFRLLEK